MATKKAAGSTSTKAATKEASRKAAPKSVPKSMPKSGRNPQGGLTQAGRDFFAKRDGSHLKAGVTGPADTPEKMLRKGSFLVRTFTHPRGPMIDPKGQPTRLALSAHAWGEKVPKSVSEAHKLAAKGHQLLAKYHAQQEKSGTPKKAAAKSAAKKAPAKGTVANKKTEKKTVANRTKAKKTSVNKPTAKKAKDG